MPSSKSNWSKALSKRRPRQNIIAMILKKAKGSRSLAGAKSVNSTSRPAKGTIDKSRRSISRSMNSSRSRALIQSASDLTGKLSKHSTRRRTTRSSKRGSFVKGQRAFYRPSKGICKVTVVGVHHDSKLEPYYTIKLRDGKEKQVDGKHLTPIQEVEKSSTNDKRRGEKNDDSKKGRITEESIGDVSRKSDMMPKDVSVTDPMSDSSSEDGRDVDSLEENEPEGSFMIGQTAYYRSPEGHISKVKVMKVYSLSSDFKFGIILSDGAYRDVRADELKALADLTSDELATLLKQKNEKPTSAEETLALPSTEDVDPGYEAEKSDSSQETDAQGSDSKQKQQPVVNEILTLPCSVEMVEAKLENGGTKTVPMYAPQTQLYYRNAQGIQRATVLETHLDDLLEPYYSILLEDGKEKQTDNAHLMLAIPEAVCAEETGPENITGRETDTEILADKLDSSDVEVEQDVDDTPAIQKPPSEEERSLVPVDTVSKSPSEVPTPQVSKEEADAAPTPQSNYFHDIAHKLSHNFSLGETVLYKNSEGEHFRATVAKLLKDKKHRPYYVVTLPGGKEKQVYDHRLTPLRVGRALSSIDDTKRSDRSRSVSRRRRSRSENRNTIRKILTRSDSVDSRGTSFSRNQIVTSSIDDKRKSITRSKSLSRRSSSRPQRSKSRVTSRSRGKIAAEDSLKRMSSLRKSKSSMR